MVSKINSEEYWTNRFDSDWDDNNGDKQSIFFMELALKMLPEWFKEAIKKDRMTICDWGCAEGDGTAIFANGFLNNKVTGIDFAASAIEKANKKYKSNNLAFKATDILKKGRQERYDVIFSSNVFEHFYDFKATYKKVSSHANNYMVVMVPFNEGDENLIPEHFHSFTGKDFPLINDDGWVVVHFVVIDTAKLKNTYWAGQQALVILARQEIIKQNSLTFDQIDLTVDKQIVEREEKRKLQKKVKALQSTIKDYEDIVENQKKEITEYWRLVNSRRYKVADKSAQFANKLAPVGSIQRKGIILPIKTAHMAKDMPHYVKWLKMQHQINQFKKEVLAVAKNKRSVIVYAGMPWFNIMRQRPHHIAVQLARLGHLMLYVDPEISYPFKAEENLYIVNGEWWLSLLQKAESVEKFYLFPAGFPKSFSDLEEITSKGFKLIYEYIDELDEVISGDLSKQMEIFRRLEELDPAFILASARKLYDQMLERFPESKVLMSANAVDITHFNNNYKIEKADAPADILDIVSNGKTIVGYYGALAPWLDYQLINYMTLNNPDKEFIFIGVDYNNGLQYLERRSNVHYLGPKPYDDLPRYAYWFDCAIIPFEKGEIATATSPVKLFEYMAMSLPTVCTRDLNECRGYKYVLMSEDNDEFIENVNKAVLLKGTKACKDALFAQAQANTWQARAHDISNKLDSTLRKGR